MDPEPANCTCGRHPVWNGTDFLGYMLSCSKCNKRTIYHRTLKKAINAWNRRIKREKR